MSPESEPRSVVVERLVAAPPSKIFGTLTSLATHAKLDGSGMVDGPGTVINDVGDTDRLQPGAEFVMPMRQGPFRYRSVNRVVEWQENSLLTWETTGRWRGHEIVGGQWWRWELAGRPAPGHTPRTPLDGSDREVVTVVRHSYLWGRARAAGVTVALWGYPRKMESAMRLTLDRLAEYVAQGQ
jgi:hypothetical protein